MTITVIQLLTAITGIIALLLKKPKDQYDQIQNSREDIQSGDTGAIGTRIDRVLVQTGSTDSSARQPSAEDVTRRIGNL